MGEINLLDRYPSSKRPIEERAKYVNAEVRAVARKFDKEYFDGERLYGYGGYSYNPRFWTETVKRLWDYYQLPEDAKILDVGCAKGFLLYDIKRLMPRSVVAGVDISTYALDNAHPESKPFVKIASADNLPFTDQSFDLVISINTIHNLCLQNCKKAITEIQRVSAKYAFITVDAWRNNDEKEKFLQWNLTALTYMHVDDWVKLFKDCGYSGDYYWFIAE